MGRAQLVTAKKEVPTWCNTRVLPAIWNLYHAFINSAHQVKEPTWTGYTVLVRRRTGGARATYDSSEGAGIS